MYYHEELELKLSAIKTNGWTSKDAPFFEVLKTLEHIKPVLTRFYLRKAQRYINKLSSTSRIDFDVLYDIMRAVETEMNEELHLEPNVLNLLVNKEVHPYRFLDAFDNNPITPKLY
jgi:hypothetical protein